MHVPSWTGNRDFDLETHLQDAGASDREASVIIVNFTEFKKYCEIWGSHSGGYEEFHLLGYNALYSVQSQLMFRRNMSPPSSGLNNKPSKKPAWSRQQAELGSLEATYSSEMSVDFQRTTRSYIPELLRNNMFYLEIHMYDVWRKIIN
jgi:hypothetical protein